MRTAHARRNLLGTPVAAGGIGPAFGLGSKSPCDCDDDAVTNGKCQAERERSVHNTETSQDGLPLPRYSVLSILGMREKALIIACCVAFMTSTNSLLASSARWNAASVSAATASWKSSRS